MSGKTIAVVDDEPFIVEMITTFFELNGYTVRGVNTGQEGLILTEVERPDLLLLDLMLPDLHGYEVAKALRAKPEFATLPIVIISARVETEARKMAEEAGANAYLTKPLRMGEVLAEVQKWLANPPAPPTPPAPEVPKPEAAAPVSPNPEATAPVSPKPEAAAPVSPKPEPAAPESPAGSNVSTPPPAPTPPVAPPPPGNVTPPAPGNVTLPADPKKS